MKTKLRIQNGPAALSVVRLASDAPWPLWLQSKDGFFSVTRTDEELSIVCKQILVPPDARAEHGWRAFKIVGPIPFEMTGVLASVIAPLGEAGISIFAVSTFDTDYILVKEENWSPARAVLDDVVEWI
ncbi:MAG TPA: ACT domain-containing protein [bacterium]|nr:ACT domain-containing protein [bacterium]HMW33197.1 ACT domain-containing protein [bacterium]HMW35484.1 ACT domain-containing protein [bacterium]HMZ03237.1 ACT domain-containing protein [bacterium]HNB10307.1 ACT domain-containing protein [bacterium]